MQEATDGAYPQLAVIENVPGFFSANGGRDFALALEGLVGCPVTIPSGGWGTSGVVFGPLGQAAWRVQDAQYHGLAQRRKRVFIVYDPRGERAGEILFEPDGGTRHPPARRTQGQDVAGTLGVSSQGGWGNDLDSNGAFIPMSYRMASFGEYSDDGTASAIKARDFKDATDLVAFTNRGFDSGDSAETLRAQSHGALPMVAQVTNTLRANAGAIKHEADQSQLVATAMAVRRLTPTECSRLQGFPDTWLDIDPPLSDSAKYRLLGNAVAVPVAAWLGNRITEAAS